MTASYRRSDFHHSPLVVFYELTRACDLACIHCRACAQPSPDPRELDTSRSLALLAQLATFPKRPMIVLTGGDPLKRPDVFELVRGARSAGLEVAMTPSATSLVTAEAITRLRDHGLRRFAVSLDGVDAATHDAFRGVRGSFNRTLRIIADARAAGLPVQVNTTIVRRNADQIEALAELLASLGIVMWSVFFLIPVGRALREQGIAPAQYEEVFARLWTEAQRRRFAIKTTEAHHYRRFVLQQKGDPLRPGTDATEQAVQRAPLGVNDGCGVMFVSHTGAIFPSGFLPIECGRFPDDAVVEVYQNNGLFRSLRSPNELGGKCGRCEYRHICGGSRARAYAVSGDPMAEEPDCVYEPGLLPRAG